MRQDMSILTRLQCVRIVDGTGKMSGKPENVRDNRKKDRIGITPKRLKAFIHAGLRVSSARAQKNKKTRKNQQKTCLNPACGQLRRCWRAKARHPTASRRLPFPQIVAPRGGELAPNTGLQPAPRALLDVGRAAPGSPVVAAPLRGLNGHAGTPLWLGNEREGQGCAGTATGSPGSRFAGFGVHPGRVGARKRAVGRFKAFGVVFSGWRVKGRP